MCPDRSCASVRAAGPNRPDRVSYVASERGSGLGSNISEGRGEVVPVPPSSNMRPSPPSVAVCIARAALSVAIRAQLTPGASHTSTLDSGPPLSDPWTNRSRSSGMSVAE